jgi:iron complex outermembrane receptor protein
MQFHKSLLLGSSTLAPLLAVGLLSGAGPAFAQSNSDATSVGEVVVTGSRIPKAAYNAAAPITIIPNETATLQGIADTATLLQQQPIASGSFQVNGLLGGYVNTGGPGVETISLRGLGANRTLVLLNGRRLGPAGVRGTVGPVDLNVLPDSILDRTEIYKDGASSIYGSDAVAGVINFITKKNIDGGNISVFGDAPQRSGGGEFEASVNYGKTFDRGYFALSADYSEQKELKNGDRKYTACATERLSDPITHKSIDFIDPLTGHTKCENVFTGIAETATTYGGAFQYTDPRLDPSVYAVPGNNIAAIFPTLAAAGFVRAGRAFQPATGPYLNYDSPLYARTSAIQPYQRTTLFGAGGFDLTPKTELYTEFLFNERKSQQHGYQQLFPVVDADNPNNPFTDVGGKKYAALPIVAFKNDQTQDVKYGRVVLGLKGSLGSIPVLQNWKWDIYGQYSDSEGKYSSDFIYNDRINAVTGPLGCDPSMITTSPAVACPNGGAGIPWFSKRVLAGQFTPEETAYLFGTANGTTKYQQALVEGSLVGDLFQLPAGALGAAVGFTVRYDKIDDQPSDQEVNGNLYNLTAAGRTKGDDTVKEVYAEFNVPIFKGLPLVKNLTGELSGRYTDYKSYGSNSTYKLGLDWEITPAFRLSGTIGTSFRAPSLYELYLAHQTSFLDQTSIDPCINYQNSTNTTLQANCAAAGIATEFAGASSGATITAGGGKGLLKAETSKADTITFTWTPAFADLKVSVDYFYIDVSNEIQQFGASSIVSGCYSSTNYPNDPLCALFTRDTDSTSANFQGIINVNDNYINVASEINRGLDLNIDYKRKVGPVKFTLDGQFTWQFQDRTILLDGSVPVDYNGTTTEPAFTGQVQLQADYEDWTAFWSVEMYGKASDTGLESFQFTDVHSSSSHNQDAYYKQYTEFRAYHDVSLRKKFDKWTVVAGIRNLFDEPPPSLSNNEGFRQGYAALNAYDLIGRRFFMRIDRKF